MQTDSQGHDLDCTPALPGEAKSMLSINLAMIYAQHRRRVLLLDGALRAR